MLRRSTDSSRLNRPFKSPFTGMKGSPRNSEGSSPSTPKTPCLGNEDKRVKSPVQSPLSSRSGRNSNVTPYHSLRAKRARLSTASVDDLREREAQLDREIAELQTESLSIEELDRQIDLLHRYNDIKDVAQIVMGRLAEIENVTVKSLHVKYGAPHCD